MSWSIPYSEKGRSLAEAREAIAATPAPQGIKDYVNAGIDALAERHGEDVLLKITAHGHVCDGPASYEVTSATIEVKRWEDPPQA